MTSLASFLYKIVSNNNDSRPIFGDETTKISMIFFLTHENAE